MGRLGVIGLCVPSLMEAAGADSVSDFFAGKTMSFCCRFPPGGGYDAYTRVLARHYGSFVPGHPSIFPSNMPGAGSLVAANYIYGKAVADGTVLAMFAASAALEPWLGKLEPWLGNKSALFDPAKFAAIGSMSQQVTYCGVWQSAGAARSFADMMTQDAVQETIFGGDDVPASHTRIRVIPGYPGSRELNLAMHRGEVNGVCPLDASSSIKSQFSDDVTSGRLKLVIQMGAKKSEEFGPYPQRFRLCQDRRGVRCAGSSVQAALARASARGPRGIPSDRLQALRAAFEATMTDADFAPRPTGWASISIRSPPAKWSS